MAQVGGEAGPVKRRGGCARGKVTLFRSKVALICRSGDDFNRRHDHLGLQARWL